MTTSQDEILAPDWRVAMPEPRRRWLRAWLWSIALMTLGVLIVGGVTRLTHSGLSIVEWEPILGVVPPVTDAQWQERFDQYRQFPEYRKLRPGMTLGEFKVIFFWEYLHRVLARAIGIVFLIPFVVFLLRKWLPPPLIKRAVFLFGLGALQGLMGWLMVASGLVDRPSVSHYRLATHLGIAFLIFGYAIWLIRDLSLPYEDSTERRSRVDATASEHRRVLRGIHVVGVLLGLQIVWGAFVAGLKAGFFANTFPLMGGRLIPATLLEREPALSNFIANPVAVQWLHRVLGTILALAVIALSLYARRVLADSFSRRMAALLLGGILGQYLLGVLTLIFAVPIVLGVAHQVTALLLFGVWAAWLHQARRLAGNHGQTARV